MNAFLGSRSTMLVPRGVGPAYSVTRNMINIAKQITRSGPTQVTHFGEALRSKTHRLFGPGMPKALDHQVLNLVICAAPGIHPTHGLVSPPERHAAIGAKLAEQAHGLAFVVDATKVDRSDADVVQPFGPVPAFTKDSGWPDEMAVGSAEGGVAVLLSTPGDGSVPLHTDGPHE